MVEFKFQWQKFKMEDSAKEFLEKYISKIKKYAESHNVSDDLVDDIYQSILEKLFELKWEISQKKVVQIVNSIWEPEDIFEDEAETTLIQHTPELNRKNENKSDLKRYEKLQKTNWTRARDKSILLWICAMFGQATWINRRIWRILALFWAFLIFSYDAEMCFLWICCCWGYILLALIFPIKDKEYKHCSSLVYFATQIRDLRFIVANFFTRFFWICKRVVKTAIPSCIRFLKKLLWPLWTFVQYCFLVCRILFLIFVLVGLWVLLYYLIFWFIRQNIDYTTIFPWITKIWVILWIISAFIFLLASIGSLIKKKLSNTVSIILAIWCGIVAIIIAIISISEIYTTMNMISWINRKQTKEKEIEVAATQPIHFNINRTVEDWDFLITENRFVSVLPTDSDKIKVVYTFNFKWKWETLSKAIENISDIDYYRDESTLNIWLANSEIFDKVTDFIPTTVEINLYIPKDLKFDFENSWIRLINFEFPFWASSQASVSAYDCKDIKYNEETDKFSCDLIMDTGRISSILEWNLKWMADVIVPLKWTNSVWSEVREWKSSRTYDPYWRFDSMRFYTGTRKDNRVLVKYSDRFFNFFIDVEYNINPDTAEFTFINSILRDVEQKWLMDSERMKHYQWRENLSDFDIQMKEDEEDKIKKEQEIQDLQDRIKVLEEKLDELTLDSSEV